MLNQKTIEIIKSCVPVLREQGLTLTKTFYKNMFEQNPEVKVMFDMGKQANGSQPKALAMTILAAAQNVDQLDRIMPAVQKIAKIHCDCNVQKEHYPIVGKHLLGAIKEVLPELATEELLDAWAQTYDVVAQVFIEEEAKEYARRAQ